MAGWRYSGRGPVLLAAGGPGCKNRTSMPAVAAAVTLLAATASVAVLAFSVAPADSSFFLKQVGHGTGGHGVGARPSRQTELSNVFTAPMERVVRHLGDTRQNAVDEASSSSLMQQDSVHSTIAAFRSLIQSDFYLKYMRTCCKTLYFSPAAQSALSGLMDMQLAPVQAPAASGMPYGVRFRYFVGDGNDMVFNGGTDQTVQFINRYFGYDMRTTSAKHRFTRKAQGYEIGVPLSHDVYQDLVEIMPQSLPDEQGMTAVDVDSLPAGASTVIFDDVPPGSRGDPAERGIATPAFRIKYCQATDHLGKLNSGLPMKVNPVDCSKLHAKYDMQCRCGNIFFFGWVWPKAGENIYEKSLLSVSALAAHDRGHQIHPILRHSPAQFSIKRIHPPPRFSIRAEQHASDTNADGADAGAAAEGDEDADSGEAGAQQGGDADKARASGCEGAPDYDPAAQNWYYETQATEGGTVRMVRHWCPSVWKPQEEWYKYQRYVSRSKNNLPGPPINDFDFLNSFARDYYKASRAKGRADAKAGTFDDFTLGNFVAKPWGKVQEPEARTIDRWNMGKSSCVGADCFDGTHHAGLGANGQAQPYDDYALMDGQGQRISARHRGRRLPSLAGERGAREGGGRAGREREGGGGR
jgi:hypothetical protein